MGIKRGLIASILFLALVTLASADNNFAFTITPLSPAIAVGDQAAYYVNITNFQDTPDVFMITVGDISWSALSEPLSDYFSGVSISPNTTRPIMLLLRPVRVMQLGQYKVDVFVRSTRTGISRKDIITVDLRSPKPEIREYLAAVRRLVDLPSQVDPREPMSVSINLENKNPRNVSELQIILSSSLITRKAQIYLGPYEKRVVTLTVQLDPLTPPQKDVLTVALIADNRTLEPIIKEEYQIIPYTDVGLEQKPAKQSILLSTQELVYTNRGNANTVKHVELETNLVQRLFTSASPRAYLIDKEGKSYLAWDLEIEPGNSKSIILTRNYRVFGLLFILLIIGVIAYFSLRSPIEITKEAVVIGMNEGGISDLKVLLHVKNRTEKGFDKLTVVDRIPNIVEVIKDADVGTLKPSKIFQHDRQGTVIKWEVGSIERFEERIITYKVRSKLTVLGNFVLPQALVKFIDSNGKERITKSSSFEITI